LDQPKVYEFAKEIGIETLALMDKIRKWDLPIKSHMAELSPENIEQIRAKLDEESSAGKKKRKKKVTKKKTAKKAATKKATSKKTTGKKTTTTRKVAVKKAVAAKPSLDHDEVSRITAMNLEAIAKDIDRQMKMLAEIDTRVLIAKDQLADFQETIQAKISAFQERNTNKPAGTRKDLVTSIRETRDEAAKIIKDSKAIHDTYDSAVKYFEKGRVAALKEAKKAEVMLIEKLHKIEAKVLEKAKEIKKSVKK
jgi:hypothetical protein